MELHEYYVKALFKEAGLPVLSGGVAYTPREAEAVARKIKTGPFWVKPQILYGYSPQAKEDLLMKPCLAENPSEVFDSANQLLGKSLKGFPADTSATIQRVYVEQAIPLKYLCRFVFRVDFNARAYTLMIVSEKGETSFTLKDLTFKPALKKEILKFLKIHDANIKKSLSDILDKAYRLFLRYGAMAVELNPIVQNNKTLVIVNGRLIFDPDSLFRFPEIVRCQETKLGHEREALAKKNAFRYTGLGGNIACLVNGIGLGWATVDLVHAKGGKVACLLDVGTDPSAPTITKAMRLALAEPNVDGILVNIFGGITNPKTIAEGLLAASGEIAAGIPIVVRLDGAGLDQGVQLLNRSVSPFLIMNTMSDAVNEIVKQLKGVR